MAENEYVISNEEINDLKDTFLKADDDGNGYLELKELRSALKLVGFDLPGYEVRNLEDDFKKSDINRDGRLSFEEFQNVYSKLKTSKETQSSFKKLVKPMRSDVKILKKDAGNSIETCHFVKDSEKEAFCRWINQNLANDCDLNLNDKPLKPEGHDLFKRCQNGLLLCKLINFSVPDTIDERSLNKGAKISIYQMLENSELALRSAESIGCHIVNVRPMDIKDGKEHLILGLVWQTIQIGLFADINLAAHPGLMRTLSDDETQDDLLRSSKEEILLRWFNYQLGKSNYTGNEITNFTDDIKDSIAYIHLLNQIAPADQDEPMSLSALKENDLLKRAEKTLQEAEKLNCRDFVSAHEIASAHQKLNMAFVANLFNKHPALDESEDALIIEENREEKTFRNWMNSLGVKPKVNYLYMDLQDCLVIFQLYDIIKPGSVDCSKVVQKFSANRQKFQKLDNCNYAMDIGKKQMNFKLVGIQGSNILDGHVMFTLALIWQLMKAYIMSLLQKLAEDGKPIGDNEIIQWANEKLQNAGKETSLTSFQDQSLSNSKLICDLVDAIKPNSIKYSILSDEDDYDTKMANARYAVSISRKIGARVFSLPEDIVEVKPKMIMTMFATLMILDFQSKKE